MTMTRFGSDDSVVSDDYPQQEVPRHARRGFWSLLIVLVGFAFFTPTMLAGAQLTQSFAFGELAVIMAIGSLVLGLYVAMLALIGAKTGLTTVLLARFTLGRYGAKWASILLGGTQVCWYAVTAVFLSELVVQGTGLESWTTPVVVVVSSVLTGVTAYYGYRGLELLSGVSVPLLLILCLWVLIQALREVGGWSGFTEWNPEGQGTVAWATAITIVVGTFVSGGTQAPNWSRFARVPWQAFVAAICAFLLCNGMMLLFGAVGAIAFQVGDFVAVLLQLNLVVAAMTLLIFNIWTTQENTAYAFGIAGAEFFNRPRKRPFIIGGVAVAIVLALTGIYEALPHYLVMLGILIPPLGGAIIGDQFFVWRGRLPHISETAFLGFRWSGIAAYIAGLLAAFVSEQASFGLPPIQGILVAIIAVPIAQRVFEQFGIDTRHEVTR